MRFVRRLFGSPSVSDTDPDDANGAWNLTPDDRPGPKLVRKRGKWLRRSLLLAGTLGLAYVSYEDPSIWPKAWSLASGVLSQVQEQALQKTAAAPPANPPLPPSPASGESMTASNTGAALAPIPVGPDASAASALPPAPVTSPPTGQKSETPASVHANSEMRPYAPPRSVTVVDPFEARAKASGLHPDLSRDLLAKLSDADFRNAAYATRTALEKTSDDSTFKWPRRREAGLATFEVRFVPGAEPDCRRYIVTVEKDRWQTTAPPVDKCGARSRQQNH